MCKEKKKKETLNHLEIEKVNWEREILRTYIH